jgi:ribonucleoside-diphosphate reductase alpha chain
MRIERRFTREGQSAYAEIEFRKAISEINQVAADVLAQKYFRKAGVPARLKKVEENDVPSFLWRSVPDEAPWPSCRRTSAIVRNRRPQAGLRPACRHLDLLGLEGRLLQDRGRRPRLHRRAALHAGHPAVAPNSPQWFNTGLHWAYGIDGPGQGHFYVDPFTGKLTKSKSAYEHPQPHACFIQSVADDLVNEGGIMDLWVREARLFKYGSGTGSNFSRCAARAKSSPAAAARRA